MRFLLIAAILLAQPLVAEGRKAKAKTPQVAGSYDVAFKKTVSSCRDVGVALGQATLEITQKGKRIRLQMPLLPNMKGSVDKDGSLRASAKRGPTVIRGLDGEFSVAGKVKGGELDIMVTAQYFSGGKQLCRQTWNAKGAKIAKTAKPGK